MFQYACGKSFSLRHKQDLLLDPGFLEHNQLQTEYFTPRKNELDIFTLTQHQAGGQTVRNFEKDNLIKKLKDALQLPVKKVYAEQPGKSVEQLDAVTPPVLLKGYWQSEDYFSGHREEIRADFTFRNALPAKWQETAEAMRQCNSVSIHFRRGDYLTNTLAVSALGVLDLSYYEAAVNYISGRLDDPRFFIFSDDTGWVSRNFLKTERFRLINASGDDLQLMSNCKHHIIANSSYSWWGAWLNSDRQKIVIAPKRWFKDDALQQLSDNLVPKDWIRI